MFFRLLMQKNRVAIFRDPVFFAYKSLYYSANSFIEHDGHHKHQDVFIFVFIINRQ